MGRSAEVVVWRSPFLLIRDYLDSMAAAWAERLVEGWGGRLAGVDL